MWVGMGMGQLGPINETPIEDYPELFPREMYGGQTPREPISRGDVYYPVSTVPSVPTRQPGGTVTTLPSQLPPAPIVPLPPVPAPAPVPSPVPLPQGTVMPLPVSQPAKPSNLVIWLLVGVGAYFILKG